MQNGLPMDKASARQRHPSQKSWRHRSERTAVPLGAAVFVLRHGIESNSKHMPREIDAGMRSVIRCIIRTSGGLCGEDIPAADAK